MSSSYYTLSNYSQNGTIAISLASFENIATVAANSLENVTVKKQTFILDKPVSGWIRKDGRVQLSLEVTVTKGTKVEETCRQIQQEVANAVQMMCETVPVRITIKVAAVK